MSNTLESRYYLEVDEIPLRNYRKAMTEQKFAYCRRNWQDGTEAEDLQAWQKVYDNYLECFGVGEKQEEYYDLQLQCIDLCLEYAESGDRFILNEYNQLISEMNKLMNVEDKGDLDDAITFVIRYTGTMIDEKQISAKTFFKLFNSCVEEQKVRNGKGHNKEE